MMKKNTMHKILNPILLVLMVNQLVTGVGRGNFSPETFEFLHEGGGILLAVLAGVHILLNFNWVKANYFSKRK
jgi:hypothetical protein